MWLALAAVLYGTYLHPAQGPHLETSSVTRHSSRGFALEAYAPQCIRAYALTGDGQLLAEASLTLHVADPGAPAAPQNLSGQPIGTSRIAWSWTAGSTAAVQYRISSDPGSGPPVTLKGYVPATQTTWQPAALQPNSRYCFGVSAVGSAGQCSEMVCLTACTCAAPPVYGARACGIYCNYGPGSPDTSYRPGTQIVFTAANGFGSGSNRAAQYAYLWDTKPAAESQSVKKVWSAGDLVLPPAADGAYYLHIWSCNEDAVANSTPLTLGPYVIRQTCTHVKSLSQGSFVVLRNKVVSGVFDDGVYVQEADRAGGIRVRGVSAAPGTIVDVCGTVGVDCGEAVLENTMLLHAGVGQTPKPLFVTNTWLGGSASGNQQAAVDSPGRSASGLAPVGILVRTTGAVTHVDPSCAYIDDGSNLDDGSGHRGIRVSLENAPAPQVGQFAEITGCCSLTQVAGNSVRYLRPRSASDVRYTQPLDPLQNCGFESPTLSPWMHVDGVSGVLAPSTPLGDITPHSGGYFMTVMPRSTTLSGAMAQVVTVPAGSYHASVWSRVFHGCSGSTTVSSRVGIDPNGGTYAGSLAIAWSPWDVQMQTGYSEWVQIKTPTVNVTNGTCTVFLQYVQRAPWYQINCFDDAQLVRD